MIVNGAYRHNKKSPPDGAVIAQSGGDLHVCFIQYGERGILSLHSRLRSIANEAYAPTNL